MKIEVLNNTKNTIPKKAIIDTCHKFLKAKKIAGDIGLGIHIVSKEKIRQLNKKYLKKDKVTDVLSFPQVIDIKELKSKKLPVQSLGDVFICYQVVLGQAKQYNRTVQKELLFLIEHGLKHLIGIHHK